MAETTGRVICVDNWLFSPSSSPSSLSQLPEPPSLDSTWISKVNGSILDCLTVIIASVYLVHVPYQQLLATHHIRSRCINTIPTVPDFVPNVMVSNIHGSLCSKLDEIATV